MKLIFKRPVFKINLMITFVIISIVNQLFHKGPATSSDMNFEGHAYLNNNSIIEISDLLNFESIPPANPKISM